LAADKDGLTASARLKRGYPYGRSSAAAQMEDILRQASIICEAAGADLADSVRLLMVHTDLHECAAAAAVRRAISQDGDPATTIIKMPAPLLVPGCTMLGDMWVGLD
jgi:hypothetical protein